MLLLTLATDYNELKTLFSDKLLQTVTMAASADSEINIFVSAAFFTSAGNI